MSTPDCDRCTLYKKAKVLEKQYREAPDHLARIGDQRAHIEALEKTNAELWRMIAGLAVAAFLFAAGGHGNE